MKKLLNLLFFYSLPFFCLAQSTSTPNGSLAQAMEMYHNKNYEKTIEITLNALNDKKLADTTRVKWLSLAGDIFFHNNNLIKSLNYKKQAYLLNIQLKDSIAIMESHAHLANVFHKQYAIIPKKDKQSPQALKYIDSALYYYNKNINEFKHLKEGYKHQISSHHSLSWIFTEANDLDKAKYHIERAIEGYRSLNLIPELDAALINKALVYIYKKDYKQSEEIYTNIIQAKRDTSNIRSLQNKRIAYGNLSFIYKSTNQYKKAYENFKLKELYTEILNNKQKKAEITAIEAKYNEQKARQEEALKTEKEREKKERFQLWFAIAALGAILIFLLGTILYRNSKLKAKNLSLALVRKELDQQREIQSLQKQHQNKIINATLDGREKERKDIAQALHDSVSSLLSSANLHLQVGKRKSPEAQNEIEKSQNIISEASDKIRDLSHQLISAVLLKFGLEYAVDNLCEKYSNEDLLFELETDDRIPRFEQAFEIKIHNIIEEFCNNIIKHSKASNATIRLHMIDNTIHITVKDNGVGFDTQKLDPKSGIGLSQIKARIESLEGEIDINSAINQGTEIAIKTPVILA